MREVRQINSRLKIEEEDKVIRYVIDGQEYKQIEVGDKVGKKEVLVKLVKKRIATRTGLARGLSLCRQTISRYMEAYQKNGREGLEDRRLTWQYLQTVREPLVGKLS